MQEYVNYLVKVCGWTKEIATNFVESFKNDSEMLKIINRRFGNENN